MRYLFQSYGYQLPIDMMAVKLRDDFCHGAEQDNIQGVSHDVEKGCPGASF